VPGYTKSPTNAAAKLMNNCNAEAATLDTPSRFSWRPFASISWAASKGGRAQRAVKPDIVS